MVKSYGESVATEFQIDPNPKFGCEPLREVKKDTTTKTRNVNRLLNYSPDITHFKSYDGKPSAQ